MVNKAGEALQHYEELLKEGSAFNKALREVPAGYDVAEIGVLGGRVFKHLVEWAESQGFRAHAFDSFAGMDTPSPCDSTMYPKGSLSVGGVINFVRRMESFGCNGDAYYVWPGYIPDCFATVPKDLCFGFVRIDVDHFRPTLLAAWWAWDKLVPGGCMSFDDWLPDLPKVPATDAIKIFVDEMEEGIKLTYSEGRELFVFKKEI